MVKAQNISKLPPELIIKILSFCDSASILEFAEAVSLQNESIWEIIKNEKFWKYTVLPPDEKFLPYLGSYTTSLTIGTSDDQSHWNLSESLISSIQSKCDNLEKLTIANCELNTDLISLSMFPRTISHLKFVNVTMPNRVKPLGRVYAVKESPFFKVQESLPKLKYIEVENCQYYLADIVAASLGNIPIGLLENIMQNQEDDSYECWPNVVIDSTKYRVSIENDEKETQFENIDEYYSKDGFVCEYYTLIWNAVRYFDQYINQENLVQFFIDQNAINRRFLPPGHPMIS